MSEPVFDKVDSALELQVIDWLQWYEFAQSDEVRLAALALELISKRKAAFAKLEASNKIMREAVETGYEALFLLMKRVTKLGEVEGEPGSPIDKGWKACDVMKLALSQANQEGE